MNKILTNRIVKFNDKLEGLNNRSASSLAKKEVKELLKQYTKRTVRTYLTTYRDSLRVYNKFVFNALKIPKGLQSEVKREYGKKIAKAQKNRKEVSDINTMIDIAIQLLDSNKATEIAAGLCLLTGRRMTEILKTAKFTNSKNSSKVMYFKGQLKTDDKKMKYEIFVLNDTKNQCKSALKKLRGLLNTSKMSNLEVSRKYESSVNSAIGAHFNRFIGKRDIDKCTAHTLRNVYALCCIAEFKEQHQTNNSFLSQILGHESDDVTTANSYQKYYLPI